MRRAWKGVGLTLVAMMLLGGSAFAQRQRGFGGRFGGGGGMLLRMPEVQTELKLTEEQKTKVTEMMDRLRQERQGQGGNFRDLSPEERQKMQAERRANEEKQVKAILNEEQVKRYRQLQLQRQGLSALSETAVQDELKFTADQKSKVQTILSEQRDEMRSLRQDGGGQDRAALRSKMEEMRKKSDTKLEAVLTDDQKTQWKAMLGVPFKFPEAPARNAARDSV